MMNNDERFNKQLQSIEEAMRTIQNEELTKIQIKHRAEELSPLFTDGWVDISKLRPHKSGMYRITIITDEMKAKSMIAYYIGKWDLWYKFVPDESAGTVTASRLDKQMIYAWKRINDKPSKIVKEACKRIAKKEEK